MSFRFTRANQNDRQTIIVLSRHFTNDYLDLVLDRWINQEKGGLYLAWDNDTLVGCCSLYFPSPTEGWLQGMRVHPDYQGQGIAYQLNAYLIELAGQEGAQVVRLITAPHNYQAVRLSEKLGFYVLGDRREIVFFKSLINTEKNPSIDKLQAPKLCKQTELEKALKYLSTGPAASGNKSMLFGPRFSFRKLTPEYLKQAVENKEVYFFIENGETAGMLITIKQVSDNHLFCGYLNAPYKSLPALFKLLPTWQAQGFQYFTFTMLQDQHIALQSGLTHFFGEYNYEAMLLMEKPLNSS